MINRFVGDIYYFTLGMSQCERRKLYAAMGSEVREIKEIPIANIVFCERPKRSTVNRMFESFDEEEFAKHLPHCVEWDCVYFLIDGHHRVSVAKLLGRKTITSEVSVYI